MAGLLTDIHERFLPSAKRDDFARVSKERFRKGSEPLR